MVNNDRIVPVMKIDLLSLYGTILKLSMSGEGTFAVLEPVDIVGDFEVSGDSLYLCNQPVRSLDITGTDAVIYFVAAYDFKGVQSGGAAVGFTDDSAEIIKDATTLYRLNYYGDNKWKVDAITPVLTSGE